MNTDELIQRIKNTKVKPSVRVASDCCSAPKYSAEELLSAKMKVSVIIPALNEEQWLQSTIESIKASYPRLHELIIGDDFADHPQPGASFRNAQRLGCDRTRFIGWRQATGDIGLFCDAHQTIPFGGIQTVCSIALKNNCIAYAGCDNHYAADLAWTQGIIRCKWSPPPKTSITRRSGIMGAFYAIPRTRLDQMDGWPPLPNWVGFGEEAVSLWAYFLDIPILCVKDVMTSHVWRGQGIPNDIPIPYQTPWAMIIGGYVAALRWYFEPETYKGFWLPRLRVLTLDGRPLIPESVFELVEMPEQLAYGEYLRTKKIKTDSDFFKDFPQ